ncbi:MAG: RES domain-containing protein [Desulfobacterales bacterium]|nr:RES domain-containing protein [Desulfobacterales bacterium]
MTITAWRIVKKTYINNVLDGEGARLYGGRWNSPGTAMIYAAENLSLATLEMLVNLSSEILLNLFAAVPILFEEKYIQKLKTLPGGWDEIPAGHFSKTIGDDWIEKRESLVLEVPSVIISLEHNYLINPMHPDFLKLKIGEPFNFGFDERLKEID